MVPFFPPDLFEEDREVLLDLVHDVGLIPQQRFILGEYTARFEELVRSSLNAVDAVACSSGTSALTLVLHAMGVGPGDEVVVPAFGCAPLAGAVVNLGARPVFADIDPWTMVVDPQEIESAVTERTAALMPAHMFSVMADMPAIQEIATRHGVRLVEDSAVAQGAVLDGRPAGMWGQAGLFSFVQVKSFGTAGEGGMVVTRDAELGKAVRMLRNHGQDGIHRFLHHRVGYNSRFDELLAAFQIHRFPGLPGRLERRARIGEYYTERFTPLQDRGVLAPPSGRDGRCYYVYNLLAQRRDELRAHLAQHGIASHIYYPRTLPAQPAFAAFAPEGRAWPNAERASRRCLAIPIYPHLTDAQVEHIADTVCSFPTGVEDQTRRRPAMVPIRSGPRLTRQDIAAEWNRRAQREGLARVMRASQPTELGAGVTDHTRRFVAGYLDAVATRLSRPVGTALEVGCGIGRLTPTIAAHAQHVVALDMTPAMLAAAGRTCAGLDNVEFHRLEAQRLPWGSSRFDVAVCVWVLMHVLDDEELSLVCHGLSRSARYLILTEYEYADVPVGPYSRLRQVEEYLELLPGSRLLERCDLHYGADRSFAALIALEPPQSPEPLS